MDLRRLTKERILVKETKMNIQSLPNGIIQTKIVGILEAAREAENAECEVDKICMLRNVGKKLKSLGTTLVDMCDQSKGRKRNGSSKTGHASKREVSGLQA